MHIISYVYINCTQDHLKGIITIHLCISIILCHHTDQADFSNWFLVDLFGARPLSTKPFINFNSSFITIFHNLRMTLCVTPQINVHNVQLYIYNVFIQIIGHI